MTHPTTPANDFSATLHLPRTNFPMRANLPAREPAWVQRWLDEQVYETVLAKRRAAGAPTYIVHLGPPYANGNFHLGHTLAYGLKDIIVRHKFLSGYASPYAPGWDCHGLPIEWKIEQELMAAGQSKRDLSVMALRDRCRAYARQWMDVQQAEWQRLGVLADWQRPYRTMDAANEAGIVRSLGQLVQRGLVYNKLRSTLWAPVEETALAEAEIEYDEQHTSTAVFVALELVDRPGEHLVIWTTTPWTLPANRAVAVHEGENYLCVQSQNKRYWVADKRADDFVDILPDKSNIGFLSLVELGPNAEEGIFSKFGNLKDHEKYGVLRGSYMIGWRYRHPLYFNDSTRNGCVFHGDHVTTDSGTGLVHIAPAHGPEDFMLGVVHTLDTRCPVNGSGRYEAYVDEGLPAGLQLAGRSVLDKQVIKDICAALGGQLLHQSAYVHKYPISWRSKAPVIYRTTQQWFIDLDGVNLPETGKSIRESALDRIHARDGVRGVHWQPSSGENRIGAMIAGRPDWCISRQRAWGVPMTIMVDKASEQPVADPAVWAHLEALVAAEGIDAWDSRLGGKEAELFPAGWLTKHGKTPADFTFVRDILDVWFDSGTTWQHVLKAESGPGQRFDRGGDGKRPADVYEEGSDQHRGWFHSSLLTSVALTGDAPYESVVTHGFVVDGQGRKFSKSLGNGVTPGELLGKFGMDIIRLWVGGSDYAEEVRYSPQIMDAAAEQYRALRNAFRWLLGNLPENGGAVAPVAPEALPELERYILHRLGTVLAEVRKDYDAFQFHTGVRTLQTFISTELSNLYFDVRKDTLYCDRADSPERVACVWVLEQIFRGLVTHLAPVIPFTTDEAWRSRYGEGACVHLETYAVPEGVEVDELKWKTGYLQIREWTNIRIEQHRVKGEVKGNVEIKVDINLNELDLRALDLETLRLVLGVSEVLFNHSGWGIGVSKHQGHKCPRCWRYYAKLEANGTCLRCEDALSVKGAV
jgi:isoleucyl-tRNA synthetase